jgi:hypothetical protein
MQAQTAVTALTTVLISIYPSRSDLTTYYSGSAVFGGFSNEAPTDGAISWSVDFTGDGTLTLTGFS